MAKRQKPEETEPAEVPDACQEMHTTGISNPEKSAEKVSVAMT